MYDVPKEYRTAIRSPTRNDRMAGKLTLTDGSTIELTDQRRYFRVGQRGQPVRVRAGAGLRQRVHGAGVAAAGAPRYPVLRFTMQRYKSTMRSSWQTAAGTPCRWASYTVAEAERSAAVVSLTGYDNMLKLERKFSGSAILGDAYTMLTQIAGTCGVGAGAKRGGDQGPLAQRRDPAPARRQLPGLHLARLRGGHCPTTGRVCHHRPAGQAADRAVWREALRDAFKKRTYQCENL